MTLSSCRKLLVAMLLAAVVLSARAQGSPAPAAPGLPPAPTPTELYPGAGMSSSYMSPGGIQLYGGQSLYLPIHAYLLHGETNARTGRPAEAPLSAHVTIRNTDPRASLRVASARLYNTEGQLLRDFLPRAQSVPPLGTYDIYVPRSAPSVNSGTNFIIEWSAERPINPPLVEALHSDGRGLLFVTTAHPIWPR
jgi:hypothetical protein